MKYDSIEQESSWFSRRVIGRATILMVGFLILFVASLIWAIPAYLPAIHLDQTSKINIPSYNRHVVVEEYVVLGEVGVKTEKKTHTDVLIGVMDQDSRTIRSAYVLSVSYSDFQSKDGVVIENEPLSKIVLSDLKIDGFLRNTTSSQRSDARCLLISEGMSAEQADSVLSSKAIGHVSLGSDKSDISYFVMLPSFAFFFFVLYALVWYFGCFRSRK